MPATLKRSTFTVSRAQEFFTARELHAQCGLPRLEWPMMIVKELADNGMDACEDAGILPELTIAIDDDVIEVHDNGPGLPRETLRRQLDFLTRTSTNSRYVSPTRGQQGNAIKTVLAAPFVADGEEGLVEVATSEYALAITVRVDPIKQEPVIEITDSDATVKSGTKWRVHYPELSSSNAPDEIGRFLPWLAAMNPHLTVVLEGAVVAQRTQDDVSKWLPSAPTYPHWYTAEDLQQLIAAYLAGDEDKFVRDLVREFAGLTSTTKAKGILETTGLGGSRLSELLVDRDFNRDRIAGLLEAMQEESKPLRPERLGVIGRDHLRSTLVAQGGDEETFRYKRVTGDSDGVPYVIEAAFAHCPEAEERELVTGINWTPTYRDPFTSLGEYGDSLSGVLADEYAGSEEPIIVFIHLATPKPVFTDRGKTSLSLSDDEGESVLSAVLKVIGPWTTQRRREERDAQAWLRRREQLAKQTKSEVSWLEAMLDVMPDAYPHVAGETGIAEARQLMYAARPRLQEITGRTLKDDYFSYTLLPRFQKENPELTADWNVVYDQRGHLEEPHTQRRVALSTLGVRDYLGEVTRAIPQLHADIPALRTMIETVGPVGRYRAIIFCEKEGMLPILQRARIPELCDVALMTTKGNTVTAARELVDELTLMLAALEREIPIIVLHDFDVMGLTIFSTFLKNTERYQYRSGLIVIDGGLRLAQAQAMQLQDESVVFSKTKSGKYKSPRPETLRENGATEEEIAFLIGDGRTGRRVELNAMTSDQFVASVKAMLEANDLNQKVVPHHADLEEAYRQMYAVHRLNAVVERAVLESGFEENGLQVPKALAKQVTDLLNQNPTWPWDQAVSELARQATVRNGPK